jgi:hypothetical protein
VQGVRQRFCLPQHTTALVADMLYSSPCNGNPLVQSTPHVAATSLATVP